MYLSKLQNVFVQIAKYICPNWYLYLSRLLTTLQVCPDISIDHLLPACTPFATFSINVATFYTTHASWLNTDWQNTGQQNTKRQNTDWRSYLNLVLHIFENFCRAGLYQELNVELVLQWRCNTCELVTIINRQNIGSAKVMFEYGNEHWTQIIYI